MPEAAPETRPSGAPTSDGVLPLIRNMGALMTMGIRPKEMSAFVPSATKVVEAAKKLVEY